MATAILEKGEYLTLEELEKRSVDINHVGSYIR